MAILLKDIQKKSYDALMAKVPEEYKVTAEPRARMCSACKMFSHVALECSLCDCSFKNGFYKPESKCKQKYW